MKKFIKFIAKYLPKNVLEVLCEDEVAGLKKKNTELIRQMKVYTNTRIGRQIRVLGSDEYDINEIVCQEIEDLYNRHMEEKAGRAVTTDKSICVYDKEGMRKVKMGLW